MKKKLLTCLSLNALLLFVCSLLAFPAQAQKEANNWYFGKNAGLSFNSNPPQILTNGQAWGQWGHASMSDAAGNLLFYSAGFLGSQQPALFDRQHLGMPNGTGFGLVPANSIFVPWPGQPQKYFNFYRYELGGSPTQPAQLFQAYSVIDLALNSGFGDVTSTKNAFIHNSDAWEVIGVQHRNNRDFWVIYHSESTNIFKSFLISPAGVNLTPIVSTPAFTPGATTGLNSIKISPDGKTIAMIVGNPLATIELLNFDAFNGTVTYKGSLPDSTVQGIEFSPDGSILYATRTVPAGTSLSNFQLVQYDLGAGTASAIFNSALTVYQSQTAFYASNRLSLQVGPDGNIYSTVGFLQSSGQSIFGSSTRYLSVINRPNLKGTACRFIPNMIDLDLNNTGLVDAGDILPTFIQSYFYRPKITMQQTCFGDTAFFALGNPAYVDSVEWNFGDPASGIHNTSTSFNPKHFYATAGSYNVQAILHFNFTSDTLNQTVYIPVTIVKPNLGPDVSLCAGDTLRLNAYQPGASYEWQDSINTDSVFVVTQPGTYWVQVTNGCGTLADTIVISPAVALALSLPADAVLCPGEQLVLSVNATGGNLVWSDSTTANTFTVTRPGTYWAQLSNSCGRWRDSITVAYRPAPNANWLPDSLTICKQSSFTLNGQHPDAISYKWQDGSANASFMATVSGTYWLEVTTACTTIRDTINLTLVPTPPLNLGPDQVLCKGEQLMLKVNARGGNIVWQDNSTDTIFTVTRAGTYWAQISNKCGSWRDSVTVTEQRCFTSAFLPNIVTPNNDNLNDKFEPKGLEAGEWQLEVYNRWGVQIYERKDYLNQWPDTKIASGTYYYLLRNKQTGKTYKGWVEVVK